MASRNRKHSRNRYHEMESIMAKVLIGDAFLFFLYMYAANRIGGWVVVKGIAAVLTILVSALGLVWLYLTREFGRRRSLWMVTACISILACILVSLSPGDCRNMIAFKKRLVLASRFFCARSVGASRHITDNMYSRR